MDQKQLVAQTVQQANNVLVTVSSNPSVDQLSACIGLTVALNKMGKHATAVFSGNVPSTIEFLQPEKTIEKNTDSLRDFIIALDKSKADKLRYKVEDRVVKIFITPYKTSISDKDLEFSQGDFNVDVVLAIGVHDQADLDKAITAHGRILHDATVVTMNTKPGGELGGVNWLDAGASSLSELATELVDVLDKKLIDGQIATALLTGIVAETERFSNAKTSPQTMSVSAQLMSAGANQQLVATKLQEPAPEPPRPPQAAPKTPEMPLAARVDENGTLEIAHDAPSAVKETPEPAPEPEPKAPQIKIDEHGDLQPLDNQLPPKQERGHTPEAKITERPYLSGPEPLPVNGDHEHMILEPPSVSASAGLGGFDERASTDPLSLPAPATPLLDREPLPTSPERTIAPPSHYSAAEAAKPAPAAEPATEQPVKAAPADAAPTPPAAADETLSQIEQELRSPHTEEAAPAPAADTSAPGAIADLASSSKPSTTAARDAVEQALSASPIGAQNPEPIQALNAQPLGASANAATPYLDVSRLDQPENAANAQKPAPNAPPEVPPPILPPTYHP